ncbi:MAG: hypothetical protein KVP17_004191 [Porospora cf. gigantea B]|uniref:uncharacterized protein n=1 Tax=Porospora cf. gigantea B TaxID=2853592 RepID=UPI0035719028|nr:MAG: hypothetical protein KVP17_004191 [Porospora cf. gigantea B]
MGRNAKINRRPRPKKDIGKADKQQKKHLKSRVDRAVRKEKAKMDRAKGVSAGSPATGHS